MERTARRGRPEFRRLDPSLSPDPTGGVAGTERYIADAAALDELIEEVLAAPAYGVDTEFHRERSYYPHLALLQIAWPDGIALVDPLAIDLSPLAKLVAGDGLAILHAAEQDLEVLERACGQMPRRLFDTQLCAGFLGFSSPSLVVLVERLLGHRLYKGDQLTDWTRRPLTAAQRAYASGDVAYLLDLHDILVERLGAVGRVTWAEEECASLLSRSRTPVVAEEAWWRLKHARQLRGQSRAVAQCVAGWREERARSLDQPVRFILPDLALVSIAHHPPRSRPELEQVRGLDGRHLAAGAAAELLEAVGRGVAMPVDAVRLPPITTLEHVVRPVTALAAAWVTQRAQELEIDPAILATRADVVAFLQSEPSGRLASGWRNDLVGEPLRHLVAGDAALALDKSGEVLLEARSFRPFGEALR